ncbi:DUF1488 family protein [Cupriavidus neocaledonicus]|uniref:Uncharacterized protein n=1 Tax=Cupriavidus neocaledonicus TaxID=1040979 RepID=A0A375HB80_9BURK|nr:DUF1488 family protein [Cupriavidus neocaledonicus]SPD47507.1 conserved protein of unknown function [Cupriavidus neocaledonicus]
MLEHFSIYSPQEDDASDRVTFRYKTNDREGSGYLSRTTLLGLARGDTAGTLLDIFDRHRDRILKAAFMQWKVNPMNEVIVLGAQDF